MLVIDGPIKQTLLDHERKKIPFSKKQLFYSSLILLLALGIGSYALGSDLISLLDLKKILPNGHYLIVLQNNSELRPTGGFIGAITTIDITNFGYKNLIFDTNIYKRDNTFTRKYQIDPPTPLKKITQGKWALRDANWDPDWSASAKQLAWFYSQEGGEKVDGVIAINASMVADLLEVIGPITLEEDNTTINQDNFFDILHYKIEKEYYEQEANRLENEPKKVIEQLARAIMRKITNPFYLAKIVQFAQQELDEKQLQFFNNDPTIQKQLTARGWSGIITDTAADYLTINNANVDGGKSSLKVQQSVYLTVSKSTVDNGFSHYLRIVRSHTGSGVWPDHVNNNYLRVLVPLGSELRSVYLNNQDAIKNTIESLVAGKSSFEIWVNTVPGERNVLELEYTSQNPMIKTNSYQLIHQKQSGVISQYLKVDFEGNILFDGEMVKDLELAF